MGSNYSILDATTGAELVKGGLNYSTNSIGAIGFTKDDRYVLVSAYQALMVYDASNGNLVKRISDFAYNLTALAVSPDGKYIIIGSENHFTYSVPALYQFMVYNSSNYSLKFTDKLAAGLWDKVISITVSPDSRYAAVSVANKTVVIIELETGKKVKTYNEDSIVNSLSYSSDMRYLTLACNDGTVRIRSLQNDSYVAMVSSVNNNQWLVFDSEGYWDASPNGGDLVAMVQGSECWNIDQFAVKNNRPDLIMDKMPLQSSAAKDNYYRQYLKRLKKTGVSENVLKSSTAVPESVIISSAVNGKTADLKLQFKDASGKLSRYNIFINDVPVFGPEGKAVNGNSAAASEKVELISGINKIEVSCVNSAGTESYRAVRYISYQPPVPEKSDLYFIGFGVSKYKDSSLNLQFADKDAKDLADMYSAMNDKYNKVIIKTYLNEEVTVNNIKQAKELLKNAKVDDTFVLFIAGHGVHDKDKEATYYYLTHNADKNNLSGTCANFELIEDLLQGIAPRNKLFLMDTCESGEIEDAVEMGFLTAANSRGIKARSARAFTVTGKDKPAKRTFLFQKDRYIYNDLARRSGAIVFSSCKGSEFSYESDKIQNGYFTKEIISAIKNKAADTNSDGVVTTDEMRDYVTQSVAKATGNLQHPTVDRDNLYQKFGFVVK